MGVNRVLIATSNPGKLRDFAGAAAALGVEIAPMPGFASLPPVVEDGLTFEANAARKPRPTAATLPERWCWRTTPGSK